MLACYVVWYDLPHISILKHAGLGGQFWRYCYGLSLLFLDKPTLFELYESLQPLELSVESVTALHSALCKQ